MYITELHRFSDLPHETLSTWSTTPHTRSPADAGVRLHKVELYIVESYGGYCGRAVAAYATEKQARTRAGNIMREPDGRGLERNWGSDHGHTQRSSTDT